MQGVTPRVHLLRFASDTSKPLQFQVDGIAELLALHKLSADAASKLDAVQIVAARHMQLAQYATHRQLCVDIFDASSNLQLGTGSIHLHGLLRQGREHADCLTRVEIFDPMEAFTVQQESMPARRAALSRHSDSNSTSRGILQVSC